VLWVPAPKQVAARGTQSVAKEKPPKAAFRSQSAGASSGVERYLVLATVSHKKESGLSLEKGGQFLSERKKSGTSRDSSLAGKPVSGSGIFV